ncbi:Uncharacterised protein [Mycobacteroides abscessus subsp. massiliense]|nr:Uncharacterised protein [Mycobacteroides abscessus subsp. massiliense]
MESDVGHFASDVGTITADGVEHVMKCGAPDDHVVEVLVPVVLLGDRPDDVRFAEDACVEFVGVQERQVGVPQAAEWQGIQILHIVEHGEQVWLVFEQLSAVRMGPHLIVGTREDRRLHAEERLIDVAVVLGVNQHAPSLQPGSPRRAVWYDTAGIRVFGQVVLHAINNRQIHESVNIFPKEAAAGWLVRVRE